MGSYIEFIVPGIPVSQPRQRTTVRFGKDGKAFAQNYTPKNDPVNAFKAACQLSASQVYSGPPLHGPLMLDLTFVLPRPQNMVWKTRPMPRVWHDKKPDRDNLQKSVMDALNKMVWADDSQICDGQVRKYIASGDEQPHTVIGITVL